jgi:putative membrane protein
LHPISQAVSLSWSVPPAASFALALTALIYLRGWFLMRRARVPFVPAWRATCFLLGLLALWIALASPLDTFSSFLITAHMLQHMLLMMVAPPLILLGAPLIPLVRGLPIFAAREFAGPFLNWRFAQHLGNALTNLWLALILMGLAMFAWHTPRLYELALRSSSWHEVEHACFFLAAILFWWPVVQPWPSRAQGPRWAVVPYLLVGDVQNTILSAILVFSDRVLYPSYSEMPRLFGLSAFHDQAASGAIMWVVGGTAFIIPAMLIAVQCLSKRMPVVEPQPQKSPDFVQELLPHAATSSLCKRAEQHFGGRRMQALTFVVLFVVAGLCLAALASRPSDDDDQALRLCTASGPFSIAVFAAPGNLETGSNGFAVLVQNSQTQEVWQDATVDLQARQVDGKQETKTVRAGTEDSENKLLQSADLDIPAEGEWSLRISVRSGSESAEFTLPLNVVESAHGFALPWSYAVLLAFSAMLLFAYVRRHRAAKVLPASESEQKAEAHTQDLEFTNKAQ